jgi:hypothetical protein
LDVVQLWLLVYTLVRLVVVVASVLMIRRKADPAVWLLLVWGVHGLLVQAWNMYVTATYFQPGRAFQTPPGYITVLSDLGGVTSLLMTYALVLYATWRFWRATRHAK